MNYFHSILFLLSYKKSIYVLSQFLFNFECFVCEYFGTEYFVSLNIGGVGGIRHIPNLQSVSR